VSYARDPYDTDQPPCRCVQDGEEFCPAHGDPSKPAPEPPADLPPDPAETTRHFPGCHPEDAQGKQEAGHQPQETENCWHCGTPTPRGCNCAECWDGADYIPPSASYHCKTCGRWWAWMTGINITEITFGEEI
jgi:hypothetical protein